MGQSFTPVWTDVDPGCGGKGEGNVPGLAGELWHFPRVASS